MVSRRAHGPVLLTALAFMALGGSVLAAGAETDICVECISVRVGPPVVVRGPFPDEIDASFAALRLPDGTFRGFSANGITYAIDGPSLSELPGERRAVLFPGKPGSLNDCGSWLTSVSRLGSQVIGFVHQEQSCNYDEGQTGKSMAIAISADDGLTWTDPGTVITGTDTLTRGTVTGEGDCSLVDGRDGYFYAYCLRNSDWQTVVARAETDNLTDWRKYFEGDWQEPGLAGRASDIGFVGTGAGYLLEHDWVAAVATDPWFGGLRLSLSADKINFVDLPSPLIPIDGSEWDRPAQTELATYATIVNPDAGGNAVGNQFVLSYLHVPAGEGFESRYLVHRAVTLEVGKSPTANTGIALTRWIDPARNRYVSTTGPLTGNRMGYEQDMLVAHMLTSAPEGVASIKFAECVRDELGQLDQILADEGSCEAQGYARERVAGWLYATEETGSVPVYRCLSQAPVSRFVSTHRDCEGLGDREFLLGYGLMP